MPDSPLDVVSAFVAAINEEDLGAMRAAMTDDHTFTDALGRSFTGAEEMIAGWRQFFDAYPGYTIDFEVAFADEFRVALFGKASGMWKVEDPLRRETWTVPAAWLAEIENGKVKKWTVYCDTGWVKPRVEAAAPEPRGGERR